MSEPEDIVYSSHLQLPDGAVAQHSVMVVGYFNSDGDTCYGIQTLGEATLAGVLGLLELAKAHMLVDAEFGS